MSFNATQYIQMLNTSSAQLNRFFSLLIYSFGTVGNILNCLVLSRPGLRRNPSAFLFLVSSMASLISIVSGLTTRMLSGWAADLTNTVDWMCKLRAFVLFVSRTTALWLLGLAAIDRWYSSSLDPALRQRSSLKKTQINVVLVIFFSIGVYSQIFYCYEANLTNTLLKCYGKTEACRLITDFAYCFISVSFPICVMILFGSLTISNIRSSSRRVALSMERQTDRTTMGQGTTWKRTDHHLLIMLLAQTALLSFFTLPQAIQKIYSTLTEQQKKSAIQTAVENFIFNLLLLFTYFSNGIPFYMYTLCGGKVFRKALFGLIPKC